MDSRSRSRLRWTPRPSTVSRSRSSRRRTGSSRRRASSTKLTPWPAPKQLHLGGLELPPLGGLEPFERQSRVRAAVEPLHGVADGLAHPFHLPVASFVER